MILWFKRFAALWLLIGLTGCASGWPGLSNRGDLTSQRSAASMHDPYPDNDAGPEMVGVRPMDFEKPRSELDRTRMLRDSWWAPQ